MNFVPAIPQVTQQKQGSGYGDWSQYAGYTKTNPFGGEGGISPVKPSDDTSASGSAIEPPSTSFAEAAKKAFNNQVNKVTNQFNTTVSNVGSAVDQAKLGNIYNATQALGGKFKAPPVGASSSNAGSSLSSGNPLLDAVKEDERNLN